MLTAQLTTMANEQSTIKQSHGSEARPNTPMADPFAGLNQLEYNNDGTCTYGDLGKQTWIQEDNASIWNNCNQTFKFTSRLLYKPNHSLRKTLPNLPSLLEEANIIKKGKESENRFIKQEGENDGKNVDRRSIDFRMFQDSLQKCNGRDQESFTISKSAVTLPKIDTYCISYVCPSINHGFAYAVSSTDLLHTKNTIPKKVKHPKTNPISKEVQNKRLENGFPHQGNVYLLFRAPSRACGLDSPGLTVHARPKKLRHLKGTKQLQKTIAKATMKTNILGLPDIKEDIWK